MPNKQVYSRSPSTGRQLLRSQLHGAGSRVASVGCLYDDYSEESGNPHYGAVGCVLPHDNADPASLSGPVKVVYREEDAE